MVDYKNVFIVERVKYTGMAFHATFRKEGRRNTVRSIPGIPCIESRGNSFQLPVVICNSKPAREVRFITAINISASTVLLSLYQPGEAS